MNKFLNYTLSILVICLIWSCSDDDDYDRKNAVSALANLNILTVDKNLEKQKIIIPKQRNFNFFDQSINNALPENYSFQSKSKKKTEFLSEDYYKWSAYRGFFNNRSIYSPIIIKDKIFLLDSSGSLRAFNLITNKKIYKKRVFSKKYLTQYQNPRMSHFNGIIYAISGTNEIIAVNAEDGSKIWSRKILSIPISTIAIDQRNIYFLTNDNKVYALKSDNGKIEWISSSNTNPTVINGSAQPIIYKDHIIIGFSNGEIVAYNKNNGQLLWQHKITINQATSSGFYLNDIDTTPRIANDIIFTSGNGSHLVAINAKTGKKIWQQKIPTITNFWLAADFIFVINDENKLICLSQKNGKAKYIKQLKLLQDKDKPESKIVYISIAMIGNKLIAADELSNLTIINPQDGEIEQVYKTGDKLFHEPIIVDGKIILHTLGAFTINLLKIW